MLIVDQQAAGLRRASGRKMALMTGLLLDGATQAGANVEGQGKGPSDDDWQKGSFAPLDPRIIVDRLPERRVRRAHRA